MAQYDVFRTDGGEVLLDCQSDLLAGFDTRFVVPLLDEADVEKHADRFNPIFTVEGDRRVMYTQFAAAVRENILKCKVASLAEHDLTIKNALDMLISGY